MALLTDSLNFGTIFFRGKTYPPDVVRANIDAVADCLNKKTISNSPFVYLFAPNHIKMVYALFGIIKSGRICVLVDPKIGKLELADMLKDSAPSVLIRIDKATDTFDFSKEFEFKHYKLGEKRLQGLDDVCLMIYTAAMDGYAKGAMLTNESLLANAKIIVQAIEVDKESISNSPIALHHLFALQSSVIASFLVGASVLITDIVAPGQMNSLVNTLGSTRVTHFHAVPLVYYLLGKIPDLKEKIRNVKVFISGGYKLPRLLYERFHEKSGKDILEGYGLTETSLAITCHAPGMPVNIRSVGKPLSECCIKIINGHDSELPLGKEGEICFKGPGLMKGYYNNDVYTQEVIPGGWFHTGDLGYMDSDGYLYLAGCKKNMLNIGGNKVFPAEVERHMKMFKNVISVSLSSKPDTMHGHFIHAAVKLRENSPEAQVAFAEWCDENIGENKLPKEVDFGQILKDSYL